MYLSEFIILGIISGLLGIFYRNILKGENQILNFMYYNWLEIWAEIPDVKEELKLNPTKLDRIKKFVAYPLGYCIYCSTTWIAIIIVSIEFSCWQLLPSWQFLLFGYLTTISVQHLIVLIVGKYVLEHPDFKE